MVNGVIFITCQVDGSTWLEECSSLNLPVSLIHDNIMPEKAKGYSVVSYIHPRLDALAELVNLLVRDLEAKNLSVVMVSPQGHALRKEKLDVIMNSIIAHELEFTFEKHLFEIEEYSYEAGIEVVNRIMERNPNTEAIVCLADVTAVGIRRRLDQLSGIRTIFVTGFDNVDAAIQNDLTTVDQQLSATGERAVNTLDTAIKAGSFDEFRTPLYIPTTLRRRDSA